MEEKYYLTPKSFIDDLITELKQFKGGMKQLVFDKYIANSTLVDLSDNAIEVESIRFAADRDKGAGHGYPSFTANLIEKGYCTALTNLKNKLNGNN